MASIDDYCDKRMEKSAAWIVNQRYNNCSDIDHMRHHHAVLRVFARHLFSTLERMQESVSLQATQLRTKPLSRPLASRLNDLHRQNIGGPKTKSVLVVNFNNQTLQGFAMEEFLEGRGNSLPGIPNWNMNWW
jgi:hypothetical protein